MWTFYNTSVVKSMADSHAHTLRRNVICDRQDTLTRVLRFTVQFRHDSIGPPSTHRSLLMKSRLTK